MRLEHEAKYSRSLTEAVLWCDVLCYALLTGNKLSSNFRVTICDVTQ
jgi:hypothetical protein